VQSSVFSRLGGRLRPAGLWRHPGFLRLWWATTVSRFGSEVTLLALPLLAALVLDASPAQMGLLLAAFTAPFLVIGLLVGVWVDRVRRAPLLVFSDLARAALLAAVPVAWAAGWLNMGLVYAVALGVGTLTVVFEVASLSLLPALIGREHLVEGNGKLEASRSLAQIGGPGLAGALVGLLGAPLAVLLDAASYVVSATFLKTLNVPDKPRTEPDAPASPRRVLREAGEGLRTVFAHRLLRPLVLCSATNNFSGLVFFAVYVLYMTEDLGLGPTAVGLVFSLGGLGALLGALVAGRASRRFGAGPTMAGAMVLCGLSGMAIPLAVAAPAVALPMVLAAEFGQWFFLVVYRVVEVSVRQTITPDHLQGRVNATERFVVYGVIPIGALLGGFLGEAAGVRVALIAGMLGMLAASLWLLFSPVRSMRS
jgi:MFS family permease